MTLRTWGFLLLIGVALFIFAGPGAHADVSNPGVWEQLQTESDLPQNQLVRAKVIGLDVREDFIGVDMKKAGSSEKVRYTLCTDLRQEPVYDARLHQRLALLRDALRSGETMEFGIRGPWSPCLDTIRVSKGA